MLEENRPKDALGSLVETVETEETVDAVETVKIAEAVYIEDLKKYNLPTDNLKARDPSASKNGITNVPQIVVHC